uniref:Uncharacterized protein n=1 Tax=Leersia perrieri TaxID=77586 RepID=A0A0D9X6P6_9ORYZ
MSSKLLAVVEAERGNGGSSPMMLYDKEKRDGREKGDNSLSARGIKHQMVLFIRRTAALFGNN